MANMTCKRKPKELLHSLLDANVHEHQYEISAHYSELQGKKHSYFHYLLFELISVMCVAEKNITLILKSSENLLIAIGILITMITIIIMYVCSYQVVSIRGKRSTQEVSSVIFKMSYNFLY